MSRSCTASFSSSCNRSVISRVVSPSDCCCDSSTRTSPVDVSINASFNENISPRFSPLINTAFVDGDDEEEEAAEEEELEEEEESSSAVASSSFSEIGVEVDSSRSPSEVSNATDVSPPAIAFESACLFLCLDLTFFLLAVVLWRDRDGVDCWLWLR